MGETKNIVLSVPDVSCEHCVRAISNALGSLPGIEDVHTNLQTKTVSLRYQPAQISLTRIESALDDAGYMVAK